MQCIQGEDGPLTVFKLFCYCHFVIRQDHGFGSPHESHELPGWLCALLLLQEQLQLYFVVARTVQPFCLLSFELEHKYPRGGSKFVFSYWFLNVTNYGVCISILFCFKLEVCFFGQHFVKIRDLGASFSRFGCFVFEFWVLRFRDLGAPFLSFGCFVFEICVLRASVFVPRLATVNND